MKKAVETATLTLGTAGDMGVIGKPLDIACAVMAGWAKREGKPCAGCGKKLRFEIASETRPPTGRARCLNPSDPLMRCDVCQGKPHDYTPTPTINDFGAVVLDSPAQSATIPENP